MSSITSTSNATITKNLNYEEKIDSSFWHIESVSASSFSDIIGCNPIFVYNTSFFNELNSSAAEKVEYLVIYKDNSPRFSVVLGISDSIASCPFSAPFGYIVSLKAKAKTHDFFIAYSLLEKYLVKSGVQKIEFYMAPEFYEPHDIPIWLNVFIQNSFSIDCCDINHYFNDLPSLLQDYDSIIQRNARKNLRISKESHCQFIKCNSDEECKIAYDIIKENRSSKGFPLHLSWEKVCTTRSIVKNSMFLVKKDSDYVASALVYELSNSIAQVIYWGDCSAFSELKSINFISYELIKHYAQLGYKYLDIGISTDYGIPNYGLCDFKDSIGCSHTNKYRLSKVLKEIT